MTLGTSPTTGLVGAAGTGRDAVLPRSLVLAEVWADLGPGLEPLSNSLGRPLARTTKLILDPLVIRPVQEPHLGAALLSVSAAQELRAALTHAGPTLRATAAWFLQLKRARRQARITDGHPQDLYFQRCFELAHQHGAPGPQAPELAREAVAELHATNGRTSVEELRRHLADPVTASGVAELVAQVWTERTVPAVRPAPAQVHAFLQTCPDVPSAAAFTALVATAAGTSAAAELDRPGAAQQLGLSRQQTIAPPAVGTRASKSQLPYPFDRSLLERLFTVLATSARDGGPRGAVQDLVTAEVHRSAGGWQLSTEPARVLLLLAEDASRVLSDLGTREATSAAAERMRSRVLRERFVQRSLRLPLPSDEPVQVRQSLLRRLWVRLHGREVRGEEITAEHAWDLIDGALRSAVLDRRDRIKAGLERNALSAVEGSWR